MFPYVVAGGLKIYMTGLGIVIAIIVFLLTSLYFCKKYKQSFWQLFHWMPLLFILLYLLGTYVTFVFQVGVIPTSYDQFISWISPYGFSFHFIGILLALVLSIGIFLRKIKRYESKKVWIDILFFSVAITIIPLGLFLLLGDNFIGKPTETFLGVKALHPDSQLNKFSAIFPVGLILSLLSLGVTIFIGVLRRIKRVYGLGLRGFILLLIGVNLIFFIQQYPRYGIVSVGPVLLDIKHHVSFLVIMYCLWVYYKWKRVS